MQTAIITVEKKIYKPFGNKTQEYKKTTANKCLPWFLHQKCLKKNLTKPTEALH